jgi:hypothetical protein
MIHPQAVIAAASVATTLVSVGAIMAQTATGMDLSAIISWGPSAAAVILVIYFLRFQEAEHAKHITLINKLSDDFSANLDKIRLEIDKMGDRMTHSQELFQDQFRRTSEDQTKVLQNTIAAVSTLQGSVAEMRQGMRDLHVMLIKILPASAGDRVTFQVEPGKLEDDEG